MDPSIHVIFLLFNSILLCVAYFYITKTMQSHKNAARPCCSVSSQLTRVSCDMKEEQYGC